MTNPIQIKFIGKDISLINNAVLADVNFSEKSILYKIKGEFSFASKPYKEVDLITDKSKILQYYSFFIESEMDRDFFNAINNEYGTPSVMYKADEALVTGVHYGVEGETITTSQLTLKECFFEDNPIQLVWIKEHYRVTVEKISKGLFKIEIGKEFFLE